MASDATATLSPQSTSPVLEDALEPILEEFAEADLQEEMDEYISKDERDDIPLADFAWPEQRKFPIDSQAHLDAAAKLIGRAPAGVQDKIKRNAIRIAKRKGLTLPDTWKDEQPPKESQETHASRESATATATPTATATLTTLSSASMAPASSPVAPRTSIATITVCFIEDGARSLNGRIYPKPIVDLLISRAQERINSPDGLPVTCFVRHSDADDDQTLKLVGMATRVWKEGTKGYAEITIADTTAGRDTVALIHGRYLRTESLRASGVISRLDSKYDLPIVVEAPGERAELDGIDFTSFPGLQSVARIRQLMLESQEKESRATSLHEVFSLDDQLHILQEEKGSEPMANASSTEERATKTEAHRKVHGHIAAVLDEVLMNKHGGNDGNGTAKEAGRKLAKKHVQRLIEAHDMAAKHGDLECEGCYGGGMDPNDIPDQMPDDGDGDDDDLDTLMGESRNDGGHETMEITPEQARKVLESNGYEVKPPKTEEQKLQEKLDEQARRLTAQFEERLKALTPAATTTPPAQSTPEPQRQTLVEGANAPAQRTLPSQIYTNGSYLRDQLHPSKWRDLLDRTRPLPEGVNPNFAVKELSVFLSARITESMAQAYGILI